MTIGQIIYNRRKELGLTLEEVGKAVGVGKSTVKKWEDGYISNMKRDKIALLAKVLDINPVVLVSSDNSMNVSLPSMVEDKAEEYASSLYLPTDERKLLTKEMLAKFEALSVIGMKKAIDRIDELVVLSDDNIHEDYRTAIHKVIDINKNHNITANDDNTNDLARIAAFGGGTFDVPAANVTAEELEALEEKLEREKLKAEILEELKCEKKSEE
jgi:transcriptional regulator with XRE-family HTH domain